MHLCEYALCVPVMMRDREGWILEMELDVRCELPCAGAGNRLSSGRAEVPLHQQPSPQPHHPSIPHSLLLTEALSSLTPFAPKVTREPCCKHLQVRGGQAGSERPSDYSAF